MHDLHRKGVPTEDDAIFWQDARAETLAELDKLKADLLAFHQEGVRQPRSPYTWCRGCSAAYPCHTVKIVRGEQ